MSNQPVVYEVIEIDEEINEDKNSSILEEYQQLKNFSAKYSKHVEVYSDSVNQNSLQYVCTECNFNIPFFEKILDHFQDRCENYIKNVCTPWYSETKCGDIYVENRWKMKYKCALCNKILFDTMIFVHLSQHLNDFKKDIKINPEIVKTAVVVKDKKIFKRKVVNVYLHENSKKKFLYCCTSCDYKSFSFLSIHSHLQSNAETCGNASYEVILEENQVDQLRKKVCEIFVNLEKMITYVCQYCFEIYAGMQLMIDHLAIHINKAILNQTSNTEDIGLKIVKAQSLVSISRKKKFSDKKWVFRCLICEREFKLNASLQVHLQTRHSIKINSNPNKEVLVLMTESPSGNEAVVSQNKNKNFNNICTEITKNVNERTSYENSHTSEDSSPRKLLDFCRRPLPNIIIKTSPNNKPLIDNSVISCNPDEDPNLYIADSDIQQNVDEVSVSENDDIIKAEANDDSSPTKLLQFCIDSNLLLRTSPAD
ncbi:zinc finger protein 423-like [Condylostylus longicornis]|uniref:zinc finger protein 423-like n=1 Tax=Condylostylus longicornis TaxID=2530218 RepID=UPI00244E5721|nr:zinc finger protein 423-like [Condylostylus longicornis]